MLQQGALLCETISFNSLQFASIRLVDLKNLPSNRSLPIERRCVMMPLVPPAYLMFRLNAEERKWGTRASLLYSLLR